MNRFCVTIRNDDLNKKDLSLWLPMSEKELSKKIHDQFGDENFLIADIKGLSGYHWSNYDNIFCLNELANLIEENNINEKDLKTIFFVEEDLEEVISIIKEQSYTILKTDNGSFLFHKYENLGRLLYENDLLKEELPKDLVDKGYINFHNIGVNYSITESWVYYEGSVISINK